MKNHRILKLVFACLIMAAVISVSSQGGTREASAQWGFCDLWETQPGLECPSGYNTCGASGWTCTFSHVVCDGPECCCWYTPSINDGRSCPSYCYS